MGGSEGQDKKKMKLEDSGSCSGGGDLQEPAGGDGAEMDSKEPEGRDGGAKVNASGGANPMEPLRESSVQVETAGAEVGGVIDRDRQDRIQLLSTFPEELWPIILNHITDPVDIQNLCSSSSFFRDHIPDEIRLLSIFPEELWTVILSQINDPRTIQNLAEASNFFRDRFPNNN